MKYFGKKSLSSFLSAVLPAIWYLLLLFSVAAMVFGSLVLYFKPLQDIITLEMTKPGSSVSPRDYQEWIEFMNMPVLLRLIVLPWLAAICVLLLLILKKARLLFTNFKNDLVFNRSNVEILSYTGKLMIAFSILTFSLSSLILSILFLMLCEIIRNGSVLQEEHDLTV